MKKCLSFLLAVLFLCSPIQFATYATEETVSVYDFFSSIQKFSDDYAPLGIAGNDISDQPLNRLIVKTSTNEPLDEDYGAIASLSGYDGFHILQYTSESKASKALDLFSKSNVESVEYDFWVNIESSKGFCYCSENTYGEVACDCKGDPEEKGFCACPDSTTSNHLSWNSSATKVDEAFDLIGNQAINCETVTVAIFDTGLYTEHEFFDPSRIVFDESYSLEIENVTYPSNVDYHYHGTHVAGILYDNTMHNVKICPYRVFGESASWLPYSVFCIALKTAIANDVDVINMSLRRKEYTETEINDIEEGILNDGETLRDIFIEAKNRNIIIVVAAGNEANNVSNYIPSSYEEVITVSATTRDNMPDTSYSNFGAEVDIGAPGTDIYSTTPRVPRKKDNDNLPVESLYMRISGTSMATPLVAAAVATLKSIIPDITPSQAERLIKETAYVPDGWDYNYGAGIINFYNLVKAVLEPEGGETPEIKLNSNDKFEIHQFALSNFTYYTLDGTEPTPENGLVYSSPLDLSNKTVSLIKAASYRNGEQIGETATHKMFRYETIKMNYRETKHPISSTYTKRIRWKSSDPNIATVDSKGNIKGVGVGETQVTARLSSGKRIIYNVKVEYSKLQWFIMVFLCGFLWYI